MKLHVLTDGNGRIFAAQALTPSIPIPPPSLSTVIRVGTGQSLHQVELHPELALHALEYTLLAELQKWKVEGRGESAKLVKR